VRPLGSLELVVAPPTCEPGQDTFVIRSARLDRLAPDRPPLLAVRWPGATGLTSYLSGCLSFTSQRLLFGNTAGVVEGGRVGPRLVYLPGSRESLCPPFGGFDSAGLRLERPPERSAPCWLTVATVHSLSDCDSLKLETILSYLIRLGTVSHRSWPLGPCFATDRPRANASGGTGESCLRPRPV